MLGRTAVTFCYPCRRQDSVENCGFGGHDTWVQKSAFWQGDLGQVTKNFCALFSLSLPEDDNSQHERVL